MIELIDIWKSFDGNDVLKGLDLEIRDSETLVVMGRSGCGKSVMLKIILRLLDMDGGRIIIDGLDTTNFDDERMMDVRKNIGMLFQGSALFDSMDVWQNLAYSLLEHTDTPIKEINRRIAELLDFVDLSGVEHKMPGELSGGMKKRVALARALVMNPKYVFFDEPTTGLDPVTAGMINNLIIRTREQYGVSSIVVTHDMASAIRIGTRFAFMDKGIISFEGDREILLKSDNPALREFLKDASWQDR